MIKQVFDDADRAKKQARIPKNASELGIVTPGLSGAITASLADGFLACSAAFEISRKLKVPLVAVGDTADDLGIRVVDCQLGCFKVKKAVHEISGKVIKPEIIEAVASEMANGRLTCTAVFGIARRLNTSPVEIADAANQRHIKIHDCQLGCF